MYWTVFYLVPEAELRVQYKLCGYESLSAHNEMQQVLLLQRGFFLKGAVLKNILISLQQHLQEKFVRIVPRISNNS